jgi:hypothetical protein
VHRDGNAYCPETDIICVWSGLFIFIYILASFNTHQSLMEAATRTDKEGTWSGIVIGTGAYRQIPRRRITRHSVYCGANFLITPFRVAAESEKSMRIPSVWRENLIALSLLLCMRSEERRDDNEPVFAPRNVIYLPTNYRLKSIMNGSLIQTWFFCCNVCVNIPLELSLFAEMTFSMYATLKWSSRCFRRIVIIWKG